MILTSVSLLDRRRHAAPDAPAWRRRNDLYLPLIQLAQQAAFPLRAASDRQIILVQGLPSAIASLREEAAT